MTQYTEEVAKVLRRQAVEQWARGVVYIAAQDGYIETALNDGSITREYHREHGRFGFGDVVVLEPARTIDDLELEAPGNLA